MSGRKLCESICNRSERIHRQIFSPDFLKEKKYEVLDISFQMKIQVISEKIDQKVLMELADAWFKSFYKICCGR